MYKLTKSQTVGYLLMISGVIVCVINYIFNAQHDQTFGYLPAYILSGIISASGLTLVFNYKVEEKE